MKNIYLIAISSLLFLGCEEFLMKNIYGLTEISEVSDLAIDSLYSQIDFKELNVTKEKSIDFYYDSIYANTNINSIQKKDLIQPIQIWYLDSSDNIIFRRITCNLPDLLSKNWNHDRIFDNFPPLNKNHSPELIEIISPYLHSSKKYKVLIFWSRIFEQRSIDVIELIIDNIKNENAELILINLDKEFVS